MSKRETYGLKPKQVRFAEEYIIDYNGSQAAIRTGYSKNSAKEQASFLLTKPNIQRYIADLQEEVRQRNNITVDELVGMMSKMMRLDLADLYHEDGTLKNIHEMSQETRMCIQSIDMVNNSGEKDPAKRFARVKLVDRMQVSEKLMRHLGGYEADNRQVNPQVLVLPVNPLEDDAQTDQDVEKDSSSNG
jgi:phage terminase small subunit